jgi:hypothetical protein
MGGTEWKWKSRQPPMALRLGSGSGGTPGVKPVLSTFAALHSALLAVGQTRVVVCLCVCVWFRRQHNVLGWTNFFCFCLPQFVVSPCRNYFYTTLQNHAPRLAAPISGRGVTNSQIEETGTIPKFLFHGHQMPGMLSNYYSLFSCTDGSRVRQLQHAFV